MATIFYDELVPWTTLTQSLGNLSIDSEEKLEILEVIEEAVHTEVLIVILTHLPDAKHEEFLELFHATPHDPALFVYLEIHARTPLRDKIRTRSQEVIEEILIDLAD